jgi:nitroreductase
MFDDNKMYRKPIMSQSAVQSINSEVASNETEISGAERFVNQTLLERRSIKSYDPEYKLSDQQFQQLMTNALLAPTSFNIQHWRFLRITDQAIREQLKAVAWDQAQVTDASEILVITADTQAWNKSPERYWENTDQDKQALLVNLLKDFYDGREWLQRDEAIRSGAMAAQNIMISAKSMGLDSCPMIGIDFDGVAELVKLPEDHVIVMLLAVGKANDEAWPRGGQLAMEEVVLENSF